MTKVEFRKSLEDTAIRIDKQKHPGKKKLRISPNALHAMNSEYGAGEVERIAEDCGFVVELGASIVSDIPLGGNQ